MNRVCKEGLFGAGVCALGVIFWVQTYKMSDSAALLPRILIGLVILLSISMLVIAVREERTKAVPDAQPPVHVGRVCAYLGLMVLYIFSVEPVGYFIVTPLFIVLSYALLRAISWWKSWVIAIGFTAFVYFLFVYFLNLPVPMGLLETWMGN